MRYEFQSDQAVAQLITVTAPIRTEAARPIACSEVNHRSSGGDGGRFGSRCAPPATGTPYCGYVGGVLERYVPGRYLGRSEPGVWSVTDNPSLPVGKRATQR
ncbi:hypothetical protein GCM10027269_12650 [Kribbella endophytica]